MLNKFPYSPGHLMVSPKRHIKDLEGLTKNELTDLFEQVRISAATLKHALNPQGFNIGANIGKVSGAGIEDHLHIHVVPRWNGDTNFMPVIGKTLIISEYLENTYKRLLPLFKKPT
jgi:ATP adenylyltransferase